MALARRFFRGGTGHDSVWWPVLLLLLVVLVPTAGVVWMMRAAVDNERLAMRQRLADVYDSQLGLAKRRVEETWMHNLAALDSLAGEEATAAQAFARCVSSGIADSVLVLDERGAVAYPAKAAIGNPAAADTDSRWQHAERLEYVEGDPTDAARLYRAIAAESNDEQLAARAEQAAARCLLRVGRQDEAVALLKRLRQRDGASDVQGRSLAADAELRLVELLEASSADRAEMAQSLVERLNRYEPPSLFADQRRFLMHELARLMRAASFPTLEAEDLAAAVLANSADAGRLRDDATPGRLEPTGVAEVWQAQTAGKRVVALFGPASLHRQLARVLEEQPIAEGVAVTARAPAEAAADDDEFVSLSLAPLVPGWRLSLAIADEQSLDMAARDRMAFYLWMAIAIVAVTAVLALLVVGALRRQMRLARLKNDLVATVSHELKTPLASIRLLVDTLLDSDGADSGFAGNGRTREYLQLISQENTRLTRLIDNFLTFSRMERGKQRFELQPMDVAETVRRAMAAMADRFAAAQAELTLDVQSPLAARGDSDALVTVFVNLLDNALKYTDGEKQVSVTARRDGEQISISVADNGIGLSPRAARRVFDRFYQVDQRLSRSQGGCGLGLAIVRFIVEAHGGTVTVESRLGAGSKFTVTLPADEISDLRAPAPKSTDEQPVCSDH